MARKCQHYRRHTNPWHREEETQTMNKQHQNNRLNIQLVKATRGDQKVRGK